MPTLAEIITHGEDRLLHHLTRNGKVRGYMQFSAPFEEAWLASMRGLSAALLRALREGRQLSPLTADTVPGRDPVAWYGIEAGSRHRARGIPLAMFLGNLKSYRRSYQDLLDEAGLEREDLESYRRIIDNYFDRIEIGVCEEWTGQTCDAALDQLRIRNRALTEEKSKYLTIFESLKDPVILLDVAGEVENMNCAATSLFAERSAPGMVYYSQEQVRLPPGLLDIDLPVREQQLQTNLGPRWFEIKSQRLLDVSERVIGTVMILSDVTEYRRACEEARAADRAKSIFLATMSHEIRTPLHGILGLAELLGHSDLSAGDRARLDAITQSGELLSSVISDILDYSKIEADVLDVEEISFPVADVAESVLGLMRPLAARKPRLRLLATLPPLPVVIGDPGKLRQILINFIGNAIKFTDQGSVSLAIEEIAGADDTCRLRFTITDTGIGVEESKLATIFDPFTQSDSSVARRYGGSGLGLAICRRLIERLGGELDVSSRPGQGSCFWFTLPYRRVEEAGAPARPVTAAVPSPCAGRALNVLVVEDNEVNAMVATGLLHTAGHNATVATGGEAALAALAAHDYDLVLMDLYLPNMHGIEVTRRIRALADPRKRRVPIVALSAQVVQTDVQACLDAGMDMFIGKPFRRVDLDRAIAFACGRVVPPGPPRPPAPVPLHEQAADLGLGSAQRLLALYRQTTPATLAALADALATEDTAAVRDLSHKLKGGASYVGCSAVFDLAEATGAAARRGDLNGLAGRVAALRQALPRILDALDAQLKEDQGAALDPAGATRPLHPNSAARLGTMAR
ncbi:Histidine kinase [Rhodovastum atsumiense]|uniref:histidine kinase n=1 Tax=Rhodovastum atsumiense TaxID=504468 RepID=A0A5M6IYK2_9PROT|nr:ATP-binding protein [Rhodovastum atsumiense]KAA5613426.1 response regulator [Rhodovastum atsumiense]CAH2603155.1 Histidine kinase [Rhodovastum atsumiense]